MSHRTLLLGLLIAATLCVHAVLALTELTLVDNVESALLIVQVQIAALLFVLWNGPALVRWLLLLAVFSTSTLVTSIHFATSSLRETYGPYCMLLLITMVPALGLQMFGARISFRPRRERGPSGTTIQRVLELTLIFAICFAVNSTTDPQDAAIVLFILGTTSGFSLVPMMVILGGLRPSRQLRALALVLLGSVLLGAVSLMTFERTVPNRAFNMYTQLASITALLGVPMLLVSAAYAWVLRCAGWRLRWNRHTSPRTTPRRQIDTAPPRLVASDVKA